MEFKLTPATGEVEVINQIKPGTLRKDNLHIMLVRQSILELSLIIDGFQGQNIAKGVGAEVLTDPKIVEQSLRTAQRLLDLLGGMDPVRFASYGNGETGNRHEVLSPSYLEALKEYAEYE